MLHFFARVVLNSPVCFSELQKIVPGREKQKIDTITQVLFSITSDFRSGFSVHFFSSTVHCQGCHLILSLQSNEDDYSKNRKMHSL